jgi:hypothetical protein
MPCSASSAALTADEQFLKLLDGDEELLRAEFDAIIAAEWPSTPPESPGDEHVDEPAGRTAQSGAHADRAQLPNRPRHPGIGGWARQRSPPAR